MEASSAATHSTPGPIARSSAGSGPTPSGNRLATITKKSSALATSALLRSARSTSRGCRRRGRREQSRAHGGEFDALRSACPANSTSWCVVKHRGAAPREMRFDQRPGERHALGVEGRKRLVQHPDGGGRRRASGARAPRGASGLATAACTAGARSRRARMQRAPRRGRPASPERPAMLRRIAEVLRGVELVLDRVQVADVGEARAVFLAQPRGSSRPFQEISPASGASRPQTMRSRLVLPLPFGAAHLQAARPAARSKERLGEEAASAPRAFGRQRAAGASEPLSSADGNSGSDDAFQHLHVDDRARRDVALVGRQDDEAVRLRHRAQDARALLAGDAHAPAALRIALEDAALEFRAPGRFLEAGDARHLEGGNGRNRDPGPESTSSASRTNW